jgi:hypothetical protein
MNLIEFRSQRMPVTGCNSVCTQTRPKTEYERLSLETDVKKSSYTRVILLNINAHLNSYFNAALLMFMAEIIKYKLAEVFTSEIETFKQKSARNVCIIYLGVLMRFGKEENKYNKF